MTNKPFNKVYLEPENRSFAEIMGNGKRYEVPRFQRDYSWEEAQLEELWNDIEHMRQSRTQHFMGYLVFQSSDNKSFQIIDGQQRLTTVSILIIAALTVFKDKIDNGEDIESNQKRLDKYHGDYMGVLDAVTLTTSPKLTLNRHNKNHYESLIHDYDIPRSRNIMATNRKLNKAFEFFRKRLNSHGLNGVGLAELVNDVCDGLLFTTITVQDDLNAYVVFETLNARGVQLSAPDLFKNYLLSTMHQSHLFQEGHFDDFEKRWAEILGQLGENNFTSFLRSYVGLSRTLPYKKDLYRILRDQVSKPENVFPYLKGIETFSPIYAALQNHEDSFWREYGDGQYTSAKKHLETLNIFNVKTPLSFLMAAYHAYKKEPQKFIKILQWVSVISLRYNVICQRSANDQEKIYNQLANRMTNEPQTPPNELKDALKPIYPDDNEFHSAFAGKAMPSRQSSKKILFVLKSIEIHLSKGDMPSALPTLEHVLPYHPDDKWKEYFGIQTYNEAIDRLGNMAILSKSDNMANEAFGHKREVLLRSGYHINHHMAQYNDWDIETLSNHQDWLAKQAKAVWKIEGLS